MGNVKQLEPRKLMNSSSPRFQDEVSNNDEFETDVGIGSVQQIPIERIARSPYQVRDFNRQQNIEELAASIASLGMLQPVLLRPRKDGIPPYELIAGERRVRAAELLHMRQVPALVLELGDRETFQAAIIENAQRENLNPIEEAIAYQRLLNEFALTQREVAEAVGKKRATISNALRLLQLEPSVIELIVAGELSAGHGRALLMLTDAAQQSRFAHRAVSQSLSVHALERLVAAFLERTEAEDDAAEDPGNTIERIERQRLKVSESLGLERVRLNVDAQGHRRLNMVFETEASWKRFIAKISRT